MKKLTIFEQSVRINGKEELKYGIAFDTREEAEEFISKVHKMWSMSSASLVDSFSEILPGLKIEV